MNTSFGGLIGLLLLVGAAPIVVRHDVPMERFQNLAAGMSQTVGQIRARDSLGVVVAEGTLIADDWVLTAAHVVDEPLEQVIVVFGGHDHPVVEIHPHPAWNGVFEELHDIALLRLGKPGTTAKPAALCDREVVVGDEIIIVGRGMTGTGLTGPRVDSEALHAATNRIDEVGELYLSFVFDHPDSGRATEFEGVSGPGDSGGPAFAIDGSGMCLAGVSSAQDSEATGGREGHYGVIEYYTNVRGVRPWIDSVIGAR